jgi:Protein of unknown function (DUF3305)
VNAPRLKDSERLRVGIVLERRRIESRWQDHTWRATAVVPGARDIAAPVRLAAGDGFERYHFATLDIEIHRSETDGYRYNLSQAQPAVYVMWRMNEGARPELFNVTVCPYEAQDYLDGGDVTVESVAMPDAVALWLAGYVARHPDAAPFEKREHRPSRDAPRKARIEEDGFG